MSDNSVLFTNNLLYQLPVPVSVATNRTVKKQWFQNRQYDAGQTMTCLWNTGTDFIDHANSSLVFRVKVEGKENEAWTCGWGSGSAMNLVRNIRIYHRSGTVFTNTQKMNLYRKTTDNYVQNEEWFKSVGQLMGYTTKDPNTGLYPDIFSYALPGVSDEITFVIPLEKVHSFFDPEGGVFIPSNISSGLRVEIDLETPEIALLNGGVEAGSPSGYKIIDCYFRTSSVSLMDSAQASINTSAQKQSLEYLYTDIFTSQNSHPGQNASVNLDINKSVAFCNGAYCVTQDQTSLNNIGDDAMICPYKTGSWWYSLGSNHYPNQKIEDSRIAYHNSLMVFDKLKHDFKNTSVTLQQFNTENGIYSVTLERDTSLALSASPVNASRALRFELFYNQPPDAQLVTCYMTYLTSARCTLLSARVDV